ncbi:SDR family oxidoreductase [Draconibacterium sp.]
MNEATKNTATNGTALITGGSSGIGYAIANELAGRGFNLILASNQEQKLQEVCEEFNTKYPVKVSSIFIDLAENEAATRLYEWCKKEKFEVDILVNNAGIFHFGEVVKTNIDKAQKIITLHTTTPALLCTLFGSDMKQRRNGNILNISSLAAYLPYPGIAYYSATKTFLKSFSRSLRTEMIDYNVNVTCICPGAVSTQLYDLGDSDRIKATKLGVMMSADKLAFLAVNAMFKRKPLLVPGFLNRLSIIFTKLIPHGVILLVRRYSKYLPPDIQ